MTKQQLINQIKKLIEQEKQYETDAIARDWVLKAQEAHGKIKGLKEALGWIERIEDCDEQEADS